VAYGEQRKGLEYPLLKQEVKSKKAEVKTALPSHSSTSPFLLEIGVEELPANDVDVAHEHLTTRIPTLLDELRLAHGDIRIFTTPRRIVVSVDSLSRISLIAKTSSKVRPLIKPSTKTASHASRAWLCEEK